MKTLLIFLFTLILVRNGFLFIIPMVPDKPFYYGIQQEKELRIIVNEVPNGIALKLALVKL